MVDMKIVLTGGGTGGHVSPNLALIPALEADGWTVEYIGSNNGIERQLVAEVGIPYHGISSGKLRRYFAWQNFIDPFKVIKGLFDAYFAIAKIKPKVVFSKGGFVTVPVIFASWLQTTQPPSAPNGTFGLGMHGYSGFQSGLVIFIWIFV